MRSETDTSPPVHGLAEQTAAILRARITSGAGRPGQKLSEAGLATELQVSRNTLREGFRLLVQEGLLRHEPNRGVFIVAPSMASILDIYRVRRLIEVPAVAQGWPRHEGVARMRAAVLRAEDAASVQDWREVGSANMDFHAAIVALTDSPRLMRLFALLEAELRLAFGLLPSPEALHEPYIRLNAAITARLEGGDPAGAALMLADYLDQSERTILAAFARLDEG